MSKWKFESVKQLSNFNFDGLLKKFFEYGLMGLVRENIQNSLDAKIHDNDEPVEIKIMTHKVNSNIIPDFEILKERISSLKGHNNYTKKTITHMKKNIDNYECDVLVFEDFNTRGLSGAKDIDQSIGKNAYRAYAYGKGVHVYDVDKERERNRGGSHGVGKIASNAASIFHTMFFANCDEFGYQTLGGTTELIDHHKDEKNYLAKGHFSDEVNNKLIPYENKGFNELFDKKTRGLKIIIPFVKKEYLDEKSTIIAVIESFLLAILENKLIVNVNDKRIDSNNIIEFIQDKNYFNNEIEEIDEFFTPLYLQTYKHHFVNNILIYDKETYYDFKLYLMHHKEINNGRTGIFRNIGMKIEDKKITSKVRSPYNALLIPLTTKEDEFLKSLENEAHNKLEYSHISDDVEKDNAKYFINQINKEIGKIIDEILEANSPVEGKLDTSDILYVTEDDKFKTLLRNRLSVINTSKKNKHKTVLKVTKTDEPGGTPRNKKGGEKTTLKSKRVKVNLDGEHSKEYFQLKEGVVKRVIMTDKELIQVNISKIKFMNKNVKTVDLFVTLVDGMGKEHNKEYNLKTQYKWIEDQNTYSKLEFDNNVIKKVDVSSDVIKLNLKSKDKNNTFSKLRFYVEA